MLANLSKHNRGSSVTPNLPNLTTDLTAYANGQMGQLPNQSITKSRQAPARTDDSQAQL